jgi:hypothetical protein
VREDSIHPPERANRPIVSAIAVREGSVAVICGTPVPGLIGFPADDFIDKPIDLDAALNRTVKYKVISGVTRSRIRCPISRRMNRRRATALFCSFSGPVRRPTH